MTVTHPELLAKKDHFAISAITDEDRRFWWSNHDCAILASVNEALCHMLVNIQLAVLCVFYLEVFAIKLAWWSKKEFSFPFLEKQLSQSSTRSCPILSALRDRSSHFVQSIQCWVVERLLRLFRLIFKLSFLNFIATFPFNWGCRWTLLWAILTLLHFVQTTPHFEIIFWNNQQFKS